MSKKNEKMDNAMNGMERVISIDNIELTSKISFEKTGEKLYVTLTIKNAEANMQTDESAFEAWIICLKARKGYRNVFIGISDKENWIGVTPQIRQFLYRLKKFGENYSWCKLSKEIQELIRKHDVANFQNLVLNHPTTEAAEKAVNVEAQLERQFVYENKKNFVAMATQMPLGVFDNKISEGSRLLPTSYLDIWSFDEKILSIYELKAKGNKRVGIISELMFYCNIINDRVRGHISHTEAAYRIDVRGLKQFLQALDSKSILIKGVFLTDELHPLIMKKKDEILKLLKTESVSFEFQTYKDAISKDNKLKDAERERQEQLIANSDVFYQAKVGGYYKNQYRPFCLGKGDENKNIFNDAQDGVNAYFRENNISFWGNGKNVPNHILSSQVSCLNHLFAVCFDHDVVTAIARELTGRSDILGVEKVLCDNDQSQYIAFEVVSDIDYLNEQGKRKNLSRGEYCTSVDAVIVANTGNGNLLIPVEWKYTESYNRDDKSIEEDLNKPSGEEAKGKERLHRYTQLIEDSDFRLSLGEGKYCGTIYYQEPFYQLMRQTLWAEQMIKHNSDERIKAVDYMHVHVVPETNDALLKQGHEWGKTMESAWRSYLTEKGKKRYKLVDPSVIVNAIEKADTGKKYGNLVNYLRTRYNYKK